MTYTALGPWITRLQINQWVCSVPAGNLSPEAMQSGSYLTFCITSKNSQLELWQHHFCCEWQRGRGKRIALFSRGGGICTIYVFQESPCLVESFALVSRKWKCEREESYEHMCCPIYHVVCDFSILSHFTLKYKIHKKTFTKAIN